MRPHNQSFITRRAGAYPNSDPSPTVARGGRRWRKRSHFVHLSLVPTPSSDRGAVLPCRMRSHSVSDLRLAVRCIRKHARLTWKFPVSSIRSAWSR